MCSISCVDAIGNFIDVSVLAQTTYLKMQNTVINVKNSSKQRSVCFPMASVDNSRSSNVCMDEHTI